MLVSSNAVLTQRKYGAGEGVQEISPFYKSFISFMKRRDVVREIETQKRLRETVQLFDPSGTFACRLRKIAFFCVIYNLLTVPVRCGFELPQTYQWIIMDILMDIPPWLRIMQNFLSPYPEDESQSSVDFLRLNRLRTLTKYVKGKFILDFVSLLPLDYALGTWYRSTRLLQWKRLDYLQKEWETTTRRNPMAYRMGKVIVLVLLPIIHLVACAWYVVARKYSDGVSAITPLPIDYMLRREQLHAQNLTFDIHEVHNSSVVELYHGLYLSGPAYEAAGHNYLSSLYFSIVYLVGYNAGIPRNTIQTVFCLFVVLIGASVFALVIGYVAIILRELDNTHQQFMDKVDNIRGFMKYGELPSSTVKNVLHFYKHMWESRRGLENINVMEGLPESLQRELLAYLHKDFVSKVPLFQGCGDLFLEEVSCCLQYVAVLPAYYVLRLGEVGREMFFIHRGQVDVVGGEGDSLIFASLSDGNFFGEVALVVPGAKRSASIRARTFTELFVLTKVDFEVLLNNYPETRLKIMQVAYERGLIPKTKLDDEGL
eukprot:TRINITY_DN30615_c0_g1_i1.p1 TRINITY_DN30615_c0_g1~~TRINITY_DN30615_c0_g1_i1.p1  ORF type:complete len:542 (+),score=48.86 TRINITY_DN30615_c0_g1_i1:59-1684(+)